MKHIITFLSLVFFVATSSGLKAQTYGSISGYIFNANDSLGLPMAHITINTGQKKHQTVTDMDGHFIIKPIEPGTYTIIVSYSGLDSLSISNIKVTPGFDTYVKNNYLTSKNLPLVEIVYKEDMLDEDGKNIVIVSPKVLTLLPIRNDLKMVLSYISTDYFRDERTNEIHFRGSRKGTSAYYIDGVRSDDLQLPGLGVGSMQIYAGGVPARFGDFTGGVVEVESKSYSDYVEEKKARDIYIKLTDAPKIVTVKKEEQKEEVKDTQNTSEEKSENQKQENQEVKKISH